MKKNIHTYAFLRLQQLLFTTLLVLFFIKGNSQPAPAQGGQVVEIIKANTMNLQKLNDSITLTILEGSVVLKQGKTIFECDRCVKNDFSKTFEAWGNVHIIDSDTTHIYSNHLRYLTDKQIAYLDGNVKLTDGHTVLTAPSLDYNMATHIASYKNSGKVVNKKTVITSREALYYTDIKDVYFKKDVLVNDPAYNIVADSLLYNTDNRVARFISKTTIRDSSNRIIKTKDGFYNLRSGEAEFGQRPDINDNNKTTLKADKVILNDKLAQAEGNAIVVDSTRSTTIIANLIYQNRVTEAVLATKKPVMIIKQDKDSIYISADTLFTGKLSDLYQLRKPVSADSTNKKDSLKINTVDSTNKIDKSKINNADNTHKSDSLKINTIDNTNKIDTLKINTIDSTNKNDKSKINNADNTHKSDSLKINTIDSTNKIDTLKINTIDSTNKKDSLKINTVDSTNKNDSLKDNLKIITVDSTNKNDSLKINTINNSNKIEKLKPNTIDNLSKKDSLKINHIDSTGAADNINIKDSLKLNNKSLKQANDSTDRYFEAFHNVRIFTDSMQARSDSLFYSFKDSIFRLYKDPVVWGKENQITGDTLFLHTKNKQPKRFEAIKNSFMITHLEHEAFNQIKSSRMDGYFTDGNLDFVRAKGSAECIYYLQDKDSAYTGINQSKSDIIDAYLKDKQLKKVVFRSEVKGTIYPMKQKSPHEMQLQGFKWREAERPKTKYELFE